MEVYESHLGRIFFCDYEIDKTYLYCEQCDDWDHLGHADTWDEVIALLEKWDGEIEYSNKYLDEKKAEFEKVIEEK